MRRRQPPRRQAARRRPSRSTVAWRDDGRPAGRPFSFKAPLSGRGNGQAVRRGTPPQLQHGAVAADQPAGAAGQREVDELLVVGIGAAQVRGGLRCRRVFGAVMVPGCDKACWVRSMRCSQTPAQHMRHLVAHGSCGQPADTPAHHRSRELGHRRLAEQQPVQYHVRVQHDTRQSRCKRELTQGGIIVFWHLGLLEGAGPNTIAGFSGVRPVSLARP